ncbi:MAG TPA: hypothetical protein VGH87_11765, partial [Polyangiaceae bacterium]
LPLPAPASRRQSHVPQSKRPEHAYNGVIATPASFATPPPLFTTSQNSLDELQVTASPHENENETLLVVVCPHARSSRTNAAETPAMSIQRNRTLGV